MTETPILSGQDIGQAHYATRAVLERLLAGTGLEFGAWVTLNLVGGSDPALDESDVLARVVHGLKVDETTARSAVSELVDRGLITRTAPTANPKITLTPAGSARRQQALDGLAQITQRLYGGLPPEDLAAAHRVLSTVTSRANAELADLA
jgi:DNA-binding MarR family transcriptional regulator